MMSIDFDVLIAGAGPAGCCLARSLAQRGWRVALLERDPAGPAGKPIVIEVERAAFFSADVPPPGPDQIIYHPRRIRCFSSRGKQAISLTGNDMPWAIRLDALVRLLAQSAAEAGVQIVPGHEVLHPLIKNGRVIGAAVRAGGRTSECHARLTVDATGRAAQLTRRLPPEMGISFPGEDERLVTAGCYLHEAEVDELRRAIADNTHGDDETWIRLGQYGSYSTVFSHASLQRQLAYILIGYRLGTGQPPIANAIRQFEADHGFFGPLLFGGDAVIRINRGLPRLVADAFLTVGEAACQVVPVTGSGVASALTAARLAADAADNALSSNDLSTKALWSYSARYHRGRGRTLAAFDVNRLYLDHFPPERVADMLEAGLIGQQDMIDTQMTRPPRFALSSLPQRIAGFCRQPKLLPPLFRAAMLTASVLRHYSKYPAQYDRDLFTTWADQETRLFTTNSF